LHHYLEKDLITEQQWKFYTVKIKKV